MPDRRLIETQLPDSSPEVDALASRWRDLPEDLLREASERLGVMGLVFAAVWAINLLLIDFVLPDLGFTASQGIPWPPILNGLALLAILSSLGLAALTRSTRIEPSRLLDLGLLHVLLNAFLIGLINHWSSDSWSSPHSISWICVLVLLYPAIIPSTPRETWVTSLLAASMDPVGMVVGAERGVIPPPSVTDLLLLFPSYICALLSGVISHVITRLGRQVQKAREIGSYELESLVGRGGMGEVWRARHRLLARSAAIKLIRPEMVRARNGDTPQRLTERFRKEAEAAATLSSPHTIELYDFGVTRDGSLYYVMELLQGLDLEALVQRFGPIPAARVSFLLQQACDSLAEAHARRMVHRDIKPANLFVCRMGLHYDFLKVLDFGLVKAARPVNEPSLQSKPELAMGTPAFMAPEMALGAPIDARTDLYAIGCVGYWLLTGQFVFPADSALKMVMRHLSEQPSPPSSRTELEVPPELDELILACLEKEPARRPASALALSEQLARSGTADGWNPELAQGWWETHRLVT